MSALYFAYGSNMSGARLAERVARAEAAGVARLADWALRFDKPGRDGSAKANVAPSPGASVWGVLWRLGEDDLLVLDRYEPGYERRALDVVTADAARSVRAQVYVYRGPGATSPPTRGYLELVLRGAREHGLPEAYLRELARP